MTDEEKRNMLEGFRKPETETKDLWTTEELLKAAKRIIERMAIDGKLQ